MSKRKSIEELVDRFLERGYKLVSKEYKNSKQKLDYICPNGHKGSISWNSFSRGHGCPKCYGNYPISIEHIKRRFLDAGYEFIHCDYVNSYSKIKYKCLNGHYGETTWSKFRQGHRCPECAGNIKYSYDYVKGFFEADGYVLISDKYVNSKQKLKYICPEGHLGSVSFGSFVRGQRCGFCYGNKKIEFEEVKKEFECRGFVVIDNFYVNSKTPIKYRCVNGHLNGISLSNLKAGWGCPDCSGNKKKTIEFIRKSLKSEGYVLNSKEYINSKTKLVSTCPDGHKWVFTWSDFNSGYRCGTCFKSSSKAEKELLSFVKENVDCKVVNNDLSVLNGKELDIFIPAKNLAIEYCGLYWHSEISGRKDKKYHRRKYDLCKEKGIRLITIFEDEYLNRPEVVKYELLNALNKTQDSVYASDCVFEEISSKKAKVFLDLYHLQGYSECKYKFGIIYEGVLIGVITFDRPDKKDPHERGDLEIKRLAFKGSRNVVGGPLKLFENSLKCIRKVYDVRKVKSYCDLRWSSLYSDVYDVLGFSSVSEIRYTPHYVKGPKRYKNQTLVLSKEEKELGKSEWDLRKSQGYDRIWDCGHRVYLYEVN